MSPRAGGSPCSAATQLGHRRRVQPARDLGRDGQPDGTGRVWAIGRAQPVAVLADHTNPLTDITFSPNGEMVATASADRTARVWKASTGAVLSTLAGSSRHRHGRPLLRQREGWLRAAATRRCDAGTSSTRRCSGSSPTCRRPWFGRAS